jgi:transcriptional regulator with XRE-family HTH domain
MIGDKLKEFREINGLVQRQIASELGVDTAYISKIENGDKPLNISHIKKLSLLFSVPESELKSLWLAEKVLNVLKNEDNALDVIEIVLNELKK